MTDCELHEPNEYRENEITFIDSIEVNLKMLPKKKKKKKKKKVKFRQFNRNVGNDTVTKADVVGFPVYGIEFRKDPDDPINKPQPKVKNKMFFARKSIKKGMANMRTRTVKSAKKVRITIGYRFSQIYKVNRD